ncbi:uncharacterized protein L199_003814 [Kwoniella botswanensis]|uniref:uncharacterized protein n=1 Tax=Kwoniella botswanensis TaxID=1268659 RepID=UPI00315DD222
MSPPILSSPFLNLNTINTILSSPTPIPIEQRIQLLEANIHLLTSSLPASIKSATTISDQRSRSEISERDRATLDIDKNRVDLGRTYLSQKVPDYIKAEMEFGIVDRNCKSILKRIERSLTRHDGEVSSGSHNKEEPPGEAWVDELKRVRIDALKGMISVEEGLGREARAERWRKAIEGLEGQANIPI